MSETGDSDAKDIPDLHVSGNVLPGSAWPTDLLHEHYSTLRAADLRFASERDRRYSEVATEREKALQIKEKADLAALQLAREIQTYKDEKANELRSQIERERGTYATKQDLVGLTQRIEATLKPIEEFVTAQRAVQTNVVESKVDRRGGLGSVVGVVGMFVGILGLIVAAAAVIIATR